MPPPTVEIRLDRLTQPPGLEPGPQPGGRDLYHGWVNSKLELQNYLLQAYYSDTSGQPQPVGFDRRITAAAWLVPLSVSAMD